MSETHPRFQKQPRPGADPVFGSRPHAIRPFEARRYGGDDPSPLTKAMLFSEFRRADRYGKGRRFARAHIAGQVLGAFYWYPGYGLQPGNWDFKSSLIPYPGAFVELAELASITPKALARDVRGYAYYVEMRDWFRDMFFVDEETGAKIYRIPAERHPRKLRARGLGLSHWVEMCELAEAYDIPIGIAAEHLADYVGTGAGAMRKSLRDRYDSNSAPPPEPIVRAWRIASDLRFLAKTNFDSSPLVQRAALLLLRRLQRLGWLQD